MSPFHKRRIMRTRVCHSRSAILYNSPSITSYIPWTITAYSGEMDRIQSYTDTRVRNANGAVEH